MRADPSTRVEVFIGRLLARCAHPYATWRTQPTSARLLVWFAYLAGGYFAVLALLAFGLAA